MFKDYLQSIEGVEFYATISMLIFISFFIVIILWLIKVDKHYIKKMKELPLEPDSYQAVLKPKEFSGKKNESKI